MPNTLQTLQKLINEKAKKQAAAEWGELEDLLSNWFDAHPSKFARMKRNQPDHYGAGKVPLMRLDSFPSNYNIADPLAKLAGDFVEKRTEVLALSMTEELLRKTELL